MSFELTTDPQPLTVKLVPTASSYPPRDRGLLSLPVLRRTGSVAQQPPVSYQGILGSMSFVNCEPSEDAEDLRAALAIRAEGEPTIPLTEVVAEYAGDLAAYPDEE